MSKAIESQIECPFYRKEEPYTIICEGLFKDTTCTHKFKTIDTKRKHEEKFCSQKRGRNCPLNRTLSILYERGELQ